MAVNESGNHRIEGQWAEFVSAEPALTDLKEEIIVLSLDVLDKKLAELALNKSDARDMVVQVLQCLSHYGDKKARTILDQHFTVE